MFYIAYDLEPPGMVDGTELATVVGKQLESTQMQLKLWPEATQRKLVLHGFGKHGLLVLVLTVEVVAVDMLVVDVVVIDVVVIDVLVVDVVVIDVLVVAVLVEDVQSEQL